MGGRTILGVATCVLGVTAARPAGAEPHKDEPIRLDYRASEGCPGPDGFAARLRARTTVARPAWPGEKAREFAVVLENGAPAVGQVTITDGLQQEGSRRVEADTCAQVADALSFMIALAIDGHLAGEPPPALASSPTAQRSGLPGASTDNGARRTAVAASMALGAETAGEGARTSASGATLATVPEPRAASVQELPAPEETADSPSAPEVRAAVLAPPSEGHAFFLGVNAAMALGVAPSALFAASPYVGWRDSRADWRPSLRLSFVRSGGDSADASSGARAVFTWTVGELDACAFELPHAAFHATLCARVEAGALEGAGVDVVAPQTSVRPWFAAGPVVLGQWSVAGVLFLEANLGLSLHITSDRFVFLPDTPVYRVPWVGANAGLGLGVRFL